MKKATRSFVAAAAAVLAAVVCAAAQAQPSSCSSDKAAAPAALLERFASADCEHCWGDPQTPEAASGTLAIDWVVPGARGEDAPMSAVATRDAQERLDWLARKPPAPRATQFTRRSGDPLKLRVAHGTPVNDYIGTSIELAAGARGPFTAWLVLVETIPAGSEGSPVERNLVRNTFTTQWPAPARGNAPRRYELRPMHVPEGAKFDRLRVVGWIEDAQHAVRAIAQSRCGAG